MAVHAWLEERIPALKHFCSTIMMIEKTSGWELWRGRLVIQSSLWQVITWSDVICWHLMAGGLKGATESKLEYFIWGLEASGRGIQWTSFSAQVRSPFPMVVQSKSWANVWFYLSKGLGWVSHMMSQYPKHWNFAILALKGMFCHRKAKKKKNFKEVS